MILSRYITNYIFGDAWAIVVEIGGTSRINERNLHSFTSELLICLQGKIPTLYRRPVRLRCPRLGGGEAWSIESGSSQRGI